VTISNFNPPLAVGPGDANTSGNQSNFISQIKEFTKHLEDSAVVGRPAVTEVDVDNSNMVERLRRSSPSLPRPAPARPSTTTEVPLARAESAIRQTSQINDGECDDEMAAISVHITSDLDMTEFDAQNLHKLV